MDKEHRTMVRRPVGQSVMLIETTPWIVLHIGQGGMVDDWWQSAPGKIAAPPTLRWESDTHRGGGGESAPG